MFFIFIMSISIIYVVSNSIENELSESFDQQAAIEQSNLVRTLIETNRYELNVQTRTWLKSNSHKLFDKSYDKSEWQSFLLGFGNSTNVSFSNSRFLIYDNDLNLIHNYQTSDSSPQFDLENKDFRKLLETTAENEVYEFDYIELADNSIKQIIIHPIEDDDFEISHYMVMVLDLNKILMNFKTVTEQDIEFRNKKYLITTTLSNESYILQGNNNYQNNDKIYFKREIATDFLFPTLENVQLYTYVDKTKINLKVKEIRNKVIGLFSIVFILFSFLYYSIIKKLKLQKAMSYESSRLASLGEMAGGIAHEINNPLTIIKGHAFRLKILATKDKLTNTAATETSNQIIDVVNRISQIVQSLRNLSRNDENSQMQITTTEQITKDALSLSEQKFKSRGVELVYINECPDTNISCRPVEISRVLVNLLNNAFDAVNEKDNHNKKVKIKVHRSEKFVRFDVIDNGIGIDAENISKIMTPFFTTKEVGHGTGLGLSLSLKTAQSHGGRLLVESKFGQTTFSLNIPVAEVNNLAA